MSSEIIRDQPHSDRLCRNLTKKDPVLDAIFRRLGPPPLWQRPAGLATLVQIVLEQQVSLASGKASFAKLKECCGGRVSSKKIIELGASGMHQQARLTRQKSSYVLAIAEANRSRELVFTRLEQLSNREVQSQLMQIKGIGIWTADVYLLMALRRKDILPLGDLALELELQHLHKLDARPSNDWIVERAKLWSPNRAVAARMIWHSYLDRLGRHHEI